MVGVLVAENNPVDATAVAGLFRRHGFEVVVAAGGADAVARSSLVDLVVLGLAQPDLAGLAVCRRIRRTGTVPIIGIAEPDADVGLVAGLRAGLDAYLTRPYGLRELLARSEALLRRTGGVGHEIVAVGPLRINTQTREVAVCGRPVALTRKEFDLLALLAANPQALLSRRQIMSAVWGDDWAGASRTIDTHVSSIRTKIGDPSVIVTVRGIGFRLGCRPGGPAGPDVPARPATSVLEVVLT